MEDADKCLETTTTQLMSTMQDDVVAILRKLDFEATQRDTSVRRALSPIKNLKVTDHGVLEISETRRHLSKGLAGFATKAQILLGD